MADADMSNLTATPTKDATAEDIAVGEHKRLLLVAGEERGVDSYPHSCTGAQAKHQSHRGGAPEHQPPRRCVAQGSLVMGPHGSAMNVARNDAFLVSFLLCYHP